MGEMLTYVQVAKIIREKIGDIGKDEQRWAERLMAISRHCDGLSCEDCVFGKPRPAEGCYCCQLHIADPEDWYYDCPDMIGLLRVLAPEELRTVPTITCRKG